MSGLIPEGEESGSAVKQEVIDFDEIWTNRKKSLVSYVITV
jgi:hypothetical protein